MARVVPLFSGSKGNSYYIGTSSQGVLIDAGRSCRQIENALEASKINLKNIGGVFITHEHTDHCNALRVLVKKYGLKVYASAGTLNALFNSNKLEPNAEVEVIEGSVSVGDMLISRINTPHDAAESCCYKVCASDGKSALVATDMGVMLPEIRLAAEQSDFAVIESNHDIRMLKNGDYPYHLKQRILSSKGHLSNIDCANELANLVQHGTLRLMLGHLSEHNNTPALALNEAIAALSAQGMKHGVDFTLDVAPSEFMPRSVIF